MAAGRPFFLHTTVFPHKGLLRRLLCRPLTDEEKGGPPAAKGSSKDTEK
jgi:hypothetical protein